MNNMNGWPFEPLDGDVRPQGGGEGPGPPCPG
jgi:hypothetical protein